MKAQSTCRPTTPSAPSSAATTRAAPPATQVVRYAEAFQRVHPAGGGASCERARLRRARPARHARPSTRPAGARGLVDADLHQIVPGSRAAGPGAHRRAAAQDDNLMVHAAMAALRARRRARADDARAARPSRSSATCSPPRPRSTARRRSSSTRSVRDLEELVELGLPIWARYVRVRGAARTSSGELDVPVEVGGATIQPGRHRRARRRRRRRGRRRAASTRCSRRRRRARRRSAASARSSQAGALSYDLDGLRAVVEEVGRRSARTSRTSATSSCSRRSPRRACASSSTSWAWRSRRARAARSTCAAGATTSADCLKLTESDTSGLAHMALRAWSREALERRVALVEAAGLGEGWIDGDVGPRPRLSLHATPTATSSSSLRGRALQPPPEHLRPSLKNQPQRYVGARRRRSSAWTTSTSSPPTCAPTASSASDVLGYRLHERIELDDGTETGAWMSATIAAHELIYTTGRLRRARPPAPPRVLGRHARGVPARGRHLPRQRRPHRGGAVQARDRAGLLPLRLRARRQPHRGHDRRLLRLRPGPRAGRVDRGRAHARARRGASRRSRASTPTGRRPSPSPPEPRPPSGQATARARSGSSRSRARARSRVGPIEPDRHLQARRELLVGRSRRASIDVSSTRWRPSSRSTAPCSALRALALDDEHVGARGIGIVDRRTCRR